MKLLNTMPPGLLPQWARAIQYNVVGAGALAARLPWRSLAWVNATTATTGGGSHAETRSRRESRVSPPRLRVSARGVLLSVSVDAAHLRREHQLPALDGRPRRPEAAGEESQAAGLVALAGEGARALDAEALGQVVRRDRLVVQRRPHRRGASHARERDAVDQPVRALAVPVVGVARGLAVGLRLVPERAAA